MFENVGWSEILILLVAALFILGPERLPEAAAWLGKSVRKVRDFASGARQQLRDEMGPEFDEYRKPLEDLRSLRNFDPKRAVTQHLFDGDPDPLGLDNVNGTNGHGNGSNGSAKPVGQPAAPEPLKPGERPPVDPDAT
ncbi:Sec-independent protein translocase protein TatB [Prauserella cavernicola]|uniref:Sec-independent protein translocase protein TatB n=1 Tax=Prauserella cavernicola TaxID=2800127 RepID=A0A934V7S9_9PSEU|nr:Sec-independent protein translocase protein TatB [Prauserella cavernicola]MBK1788907.1 Sec-independent protein translocase subunit TatB [Prauserella cavernicola]